MKENYIIRAFWDDEAKVWVASSENFVGIATWAHTIEELLGKLNIMLPEILEANHEIDFDELPMQLLIDNTIITNKTCA